jgi:predicted dehydrogenase
MSQSSINRRSFLSHSAGAGAGLALAGFPAIAKSRDVNGQIRVGIAGPGGRGRGIMREFFEHNQRFNARLTAVCDVWNDAREQAKALTEERQGTTPKVYRHHEQIVNDPEIDALIIATPDHAHAQILEMAAQAGKDAYCEKPMGNVLSETNAALDAVKKSGSIVQIGTQRRSSPKYRQAAKMIADGIIGDVVKVDLYWSWYSPYRWAKKDKDLAKIKEGDVDWNTWLMGRPYRPFDPRIFRCFRLFKDFSSGIIDQWMSHGIDLAHMLSGVTYPSSVVAHGGIYQWKDYRENPDTQEITLEYRKGDRKFLTVYSTNWINGYGSGTRVHGTLGSFKGEAISHRDNDWYFSGKGVKADGRVADKVPVEGDPGETDHMANWLDAVRSRDSKRLYAPVEAGYGHSIACIMATDSYWSGKRMVFDPEKRTIQAG